MIVYTDGIDHNSDFGRKESIELIEESGILVFPIQYDSREYYKTARTATTRTETRRQGADGRALPADIRAIRTIPEAVTPATRR